MKIAFVEPYKFLPPTGGGHKACYQFCSQTALFAELVCLSTTNNEIAPHLPFQVVKLFQDIKLKYLNPFVAQKIYAYCKQEQITHLILMQPFMGLILLPVAKKLGIPLIIYSLNIEHERFATVGKWWSPMMKWLETIVYRRSQAVFFISYDDLTVAQEEMNLATQQTLFVPYGIEQTALEVDSHGRAKKTIAAKHNLQADAIWLIFFGSLDYPPNIDGLQRLLDFFLPVWQTQVEQPYELLICGGNLPPAFVHRLTIDTLPHVHYLGFVDNIKQYVQAADFMINPVVLGGGVKIKVMDAIAWGTTVVSTESGAKGMLLEACGDKLIVHADDDYEGMVTSIMTGLEKGWHPTPPAFYKTYHYEAIGKRTYEFLRALGKLN